MLRGQLTPKLYHYATIVETRRRHARRALRHAAPRAKGRVDLHAGNGIAAIANAQHIPVQESPFNCQHDEV